MATYNDLEEAFFKSSLRTGGILKAQKLVFKQLAANIGGIGHWPTRATQPLFDIAVQRYLDKTLDTPKTDTIV